MVGRAVEVVIEFLDVLPMVALAVVEAKKTFFQNGVLPVPEGGRKAQVLLVVADTADALFPPAPGLGAGLVVGRRVPGVAVGAVIFPHGAPLAVAQVGAPFQAVRVVLHGAKVGEVAGSFLGPGWLDRLLIRKEIGKFVFPSQPGLSTT